MPAVRWPSAGGNAITKTTRLIAALALAALLGIGLRTAEATNRQSPAGVRSSNPRLVTLIAQGTEQSATFRGLIETIRASDGIVYVEAGECGYYVRSCLVGVSVAGQFRMLWIEVDTERTDLDLIASIGHELQHAVEVLTDSDARSGAAMFHFFLRVGKRPRGRPAFETTAAIDAGIAVRDEIQKAQPQLKHD